ncbi:hypothetical protein [Metapseudomonas furukawaii]
MRFPFLLAALACIAPMLAGAAERPNILLIVAHLGFRTIRRIATGGTGGS